MDVLCTFCGEPWDIYTFHDVAEEQGSTFDKVYAAFRTAGCEATGWGGCNPDTKKDTADPTTAMLYELLGDDVDGAAAMIEDMPSYFRNW